jgi:plastocyanin
MFLGLVFGGLMLAVGAVILAITLLYWLYEAIRVYDHDLGETAVALPEVTHDGPPPGVHMPGPSYRPFLGAIGAAMLMAGLVFGEWLLVAGVIALVVTLVGWLVDARKEWDKTVEADRTGHLENIPAPRTPGLLLVGLLVLFLGAAIVQAGWVPPREASGGGAPAASGEPPTTGEPGGGGAPEPSAAPDADVVLTAFQVKFDTNAFTAPADVPWTLALVNNDPGTPHNVELKNPDGTEAWKGEIFNGVETRVYDVPALPAGQYPFLCTVHPTMNGTATLQ